jgi:hypothetical protein
LAHVGAASFGAAPGHVDAVFRRLPDEKIAFQYRNDEFVRFNQDTREPVRRLHQAVHQSASTLDLGPGTGYILQNTRWLHGRTSYRGSRLMARVVGHAASPAVDSGLAGFTPTR